MSRSGYVRTFGSKREGKRTLQRQFLLDKLKGNIVLIGKVDKPRYAPISSYNLQVHILILHIYILMYEQ